LKRLNPGIGAALPPAPLPAPLWLAPPAAPLAATPPVAVLAAAPPAGLLLLLELPQPPAVTASTASPAVIARLGTDPPRGRVSERRIVHDAHHARAVAHGAEIVLELEDQSYGSRDYAARDPEGNLWSFGTYNLAAASSSPAESPSAAASSS
jgi:hypothetical protein